MLGCRDPSSSQNGLTSQSPSPRRTFSSKINTGSAADIIFAKTCVIKGFLVHNVLVDTGSAADIIFAKAFRQIQEPEDKIHDATHPLCGFGGRQIAALGKSRCQRPSGSSTTQGLNRLSLTLLTWSTPIMQSLVEGHSMLSKLYSIQHTYA